MLIITFFEDDHVLLEAREAIGLPDIVYFVFEGGFLTVLHRFVFHRDFLLVVRKFVLVGGHVKPSSSPDNFIL